MTPTWSVLIAVHAVCAGYALLFGGVQLFRRKGDRPHRVLGWLWVSAMAVALVTSFGILTISGTFGLLHGLSLFTAGTIAVGIVQARRGRIRSHRAFMIGSYLGLVGAFVGVLAVPTRRIPQLAAQQPWLLVLLVIVVVASTAMTVLGVAWSRTPRVKESP
ncbi:MAG: DUF2306 domain-containing protein [Microbacterium sp.]|jgi:uncharacterized membrane protein|uniref:DUF2306 domain-containing protein n=1 Tax=Microbacterium sp. TaxID=51671 RepID=UPI0028303FD1|nr:DUF2306 domain-containing protein [Microbacterium sp.]MDR2322252.1 DUF2306 domain-containing protein [Microbacterium sp.]